MEKEKFSLNFEKIINPINNNFLFLTQTKPHGPTNKRLFSIRSPRGTATLFLGRQDRTGIQGLRTIRGNHEAAI